MIKDWVPAAKENLRQRYHFVRETPGTLWSLPEIRYTLVAVSVVILVSMISWAVRLMQPEIQARPQASTADFHVICTNPSCGKDSVVHRKIKFAGFPVECPYCRQDSGARGLRTSSGPNTGKLVPAELRADGWYEVGTDRRIRRR